MADKNMEAQISVEFEEAASRQSLNSGETINTLWGKVKRWLSDLKAVAFSGSYIDLSDRPTTATTKSDGLMSAGDKGKLDNADNTYALKSKYGNTTIDVGRKADTTIGNYSTAEGRNTTASGNYSHAEGYSTTASGDSSHAEGCGTTASGDSSHAEGYYTTASGAFSHAGGSNTKALHDNEVAYGKYNKSSSDTLFSVGDGTSDSARHNAFEITTTGGKLHDKDIATTDLIPMELPANGGNADTVSSLRTSSNYRDIFSTSLDNTHPGWNRKCYAYGQSNDSTLDTYIENAPETGLTALWYEVETIGTTYRAYQIAYGCYTHQRKSFIRYMHDSSWSGWNEISTAPIGVMTYTITFSEVTWERSYGGQGKYFYAPDALNVNKILSVSIDQWSGLLPDEWVIPYIRTDKQFAIFSNVGKTSGIIGIRIAYI